MDNIKFMFNYVNNHLGWNYPENPEEYTKEEFDAMKHEVLFDIEQMIDWCFDKSDFDGEKKFSEEYDKVEAMEYDGN